MLNVSPILNLFIAFHHYTLPQSILILWKLVGIPYLSEIVKKSMNQSVINVYVSQSALGNSKIVHFIPVSGPVRGFGYTVSGVFFFFY